MQRHDLIHVENAIWLLVTRTGLPFYDFDFALNLTCRHPYKHPNPVTAIARIGVYEDYEENYRELATIGIDLVHSPSEHVRASELPVWYKILEDLTPKSLWFDGAPDVNEITHALHWPIFLKGQRQTSKHQRSLAIIDGPEAFRRAMDNFQNDPILRWQKIVCREYVCLRPVEDPLADRIPSSFEFRTFWWRGNLVGCGRYWWEGKPYVMTDEESKQAISLAQEAASRMNVPFLVVDVAQTRDGNWIVIECNDAQESGYAGIAPLVLWRNIIEIEMTRSK